MNGPPWTVQRLIVVTADYLAKRGIDPPRLQTERLLAHVLNLPRIRLYTEFERPLDEQELARFRELVRRAGEDEPVAYLLGTADFFNLTLKVSADVLIPRPDTETLVEHVLQDLRGDAIASPKLADLGTGSGAIAAALASNLKDATVTAVERSPAAAAIARENFATLKLDDRVDLREGSWLEPLNADEPLDVIASNPPYIRSNHVAELDRSVREYEPHVALDGGADGLDPHRHLLQHAAGYLKPQGRLYLEIAFDQGDAARELATQHGWQDVQIVKDYGRNDRMLKCRRP